MAWTLVTCFKTEFRFKNDSAGRFNQSFGTFKLFGRRNDLELAMLAKI
jgi:hypothetical protein